jgi:hypothetical protein
MLDLHDLQNEFLSLAEALAEKLSTSATKVEARYVASVLDRTICDEAALWLLRNRSDEADIRVDAYWTSKHECAKRKVAEGLINRLCDLGIPAEITLESQGANARQDISMVLRKPDGSVGKRVAVEVKTGVVLDFSQLERLMRDSDIVILARVNTEHVAVLRSREYNAVLAQSLMIKIGRVKRLIEGRPCMVQGRDCLLCMNDECICAQGLSRSRFVVLRGDEFDADIDAFLKMLPSVVNRVVEMVVREASSERA